MKIIELQSGSRIPIPELPGIYAWYYRPSVFGNRTAEILGKLVTNPSRVKTEIAMRYRLTWEAESDVNILHSSERKPINEFFSETIANSDDLIKSFLLNFMVPHFTKPLYIGIHKTNLRERIRQHRDLLTQLWDSESDVHRYLSAHPKATVEKVIKELNLNVPDRDLRHTFALNARVKGLTLRDLVVYAYPIQNPEQLSTLEDILQLLADPICGRR